MNQQDLFGANEARERLAIERRAADRQEVEARRAMTRRGDRATSVAAAAKVKRTSIRETVLTYAKDCGAKGFIDDDLKRCFGGAESSYRKRRSELTQEGVLIDTGRTSQNRRGQSETVWAINPNADPKAKRVVGAPTRASRMRAALRKAADTFHRYERLHAAKGTADGDAKAATNRALAEEMEAALK